jgi:hypothetical protein
MLKRSLLIAAIAGIFSACGYIGAYWPPWLKPDYTSPPPAPPPAQHTTYSSSHRRNRERARIAHRSAKTREVEEASVPPPVENVAVDRTAPASMPNAPKVSFTLAGDTEDRAEAESLLKKTDANLAQARARSLTEAQRETYDRASQLANRARHALADNDCAAASSLAGKALSLAAGL